MRIISQDKKWDIPYDRASLEVVNESIYANVFSFDDDSCKLGEYETHKRALEVMEEIRNKFAASENYKLLSDTARMNFISALSRVENPITKVMVYEMPQD